MNRRRAVCRRAHRNAPLMAAALRLQLAGNGQAWGGRVRCTRRSGRRRTAFTMRSACTARAASRADSWHLRSRPCGLTGRGAAVCAGCVRVVWHAASRAEVGSVCLQAMHRLWQAPSRRVSRQSWGRQQRRTPGGVVPAHGRGMGGASLRTALGSRLATAVYALHTHGAMRAVRATFSTGHRALLHPARGLLTGGRGAPAAQPVHNYPSRRRRAPMGGALTSSQLLTGWRRAHACYQRAG